jgi:CRISPR-associated protein Cas5t
MRVAKVVIEAPAASFRYPHFLIGRQPTFDMPPPSTIYGHIASAAGELLPPDSFRFGYTFEFRSRASDLEHQHIITGGGNPFEVAGSKFRTSVQATIQPHHRDFLFRPRLTLYLDPPQLAAAFRAPVFCVVLGRSQDLAEIVSVEEIDLEEQPGAYLEHTLLPFSFRESIGFGVTVLMPRYIEPPPQRRAHFDRFITLRDRVYAGEVDRGEGLGPRRMLGREGQRNSWWVDLASARDHGVGRGVIFHSCAGTV